MSSAWRPLGTLQWRAGCKLLQPGKDQIGLVDCTEARKFLAETLHYRRFIVATRFRKRAPCLTS